MLPEHILVPLDFSSHADKALQYAIELAGLTQARLSLLHVIQPPPVAGPAAGAGAVMATYFEQAEAEAREMMATCTKRVEDAGLRCEPLLTQGSPAQQVVDLATANQIDLIIMGTHGRTGLSHLLLGSVAERVVRLAPCPVLVTRDREATSSTSEA